MDFLLEPFYYNWLIVAAVLLIIEVASFTLLFLWFAIAAAIMAGVSFVFPNMSLTTHLWTFSLLALASVVIWHRLFKHTQKTMGDNKMNNRAVRYVGRTATLVEPVSNGYGKIQLEDSFWRVLCNEDLPKGTRVEITDADGVLLHVKKAS